MDTFAPPRCNGCGAGLAPGTQSVATSCRHLLCMECAQAVLDEAAPCPICEQPITRANVKVVAILHAGTSVKLALCGQAPQAVMEAAHEAVAHFCEQQRLVALYTKKRLEAKQHKIEASCRAKLDELQRVFVEAKRRYQAERQLKDAAVSDAQELQQKYGQKSMQARKLQDMIRALQQENDDLKRQLAAGGGGGRLLANGGGGGGSMAAGGHHHHHRQQQQQHHQQFVYAHQQPGGPQLVTTLHHTKSVMELSPSAAGGVFFGAGAGAALGGSGHVRPSTPSGYGGAAGSLAQPRGSMFATGSGSPAAAGGAGGHHMMRRPTTAGSGGAGGGGGMLAAMLGGGGGGGGGGSMRLGASFGGGAARPSVSRGGGLGSLGSPAHAHMSM